MHPILFEIGGFPVTTYAALNVVAYLACVAVAVRLGERDGIPRKRMVDLTFWLLIAAIVGSRVGYLVEQAPFYFGVCLDPELAAPPAACDDYWRPWRGGFVFYGGLAAAIAVAAGLVRRYELSFWRSVDAIGPGLALAHAIGRVGCFFGGCCYGAVAHVPWAVRFPAHSLAGDLPRHPTQLYEAAAETAIFLFLWRLHGRKGTDGRVFLTYLVLYAVARFAVELVRGDASRGYLVELELPWLGDLLGLAPGSAPLLSWAQVISLAIGSTALLLLRARGRRARARTRIRS